MISTALVRSCLLHDLLDQAAARDAAAVAVSTSDRRLTWGELASRTRRVAETLYLAGVRRGDRIVVSASEPVAVAELVYAVSRAGAAFSILHEEVRGAPLEHVLRDAEPRLFVSDDDAAGRTAEAAGVPFLGIGDLAGAGSDAGLPADPGTLAVDMVSLIYTSGTTSLPKAVVSTHEQVLFAASAIQECLGYRADDVVYCPLPLSFDYGLYQLHLAALSGARLHFGSVTEVGPVLLRSLEEVGATILAGVPSVSDRLAWLLRRSASRLGGLRLLTNTGAALSESTVESLRAALPGLRIQVMYGLTECKRTAIMPPDGDLEHPGSCGRPLPGTEVLVVDDDGTRLPAGEIGQFVVRGPNVMAGYWRRPELTAERFLRDGPLSPQLHTGDYGWMDDDGYLYFSGRRDDLYKERGFRLSATEVEAAATRVDGVTSATVLPPDGKRPATLAYVGAIPADQVQDLMREQIEPFKVPRRCVRLAELPTNGNGKIDRERLAELVTGPATATPVGERRPSPASS